MTSLTDVVDVVIGVDTHVHTHSAAAIDAHTGAVIEEITVETTAQGYDELVEFAEEHPLRAWAIESTGGHGAGLTRHLQRGEEFVIELDRPERAKRRNGAKSDPLDAVRAAREALARPRLGTPRRGGDRQALSVLLATRRSAVEGATVAQRQLFSLVIAAPELLRARFRGQKLPAMVRTAAALRMHASWDTETTTTAAMLRTLAKRSQELSKEAAEHQRAIVAIVRSWRPDLLAQLGVGPIVAAVVLCAWSHPGRNRPVPSSELTFSQSCSDNRQRSVLIAPSSDQHMVLVSDERTGKSAVPRPGGPPRFPNLRDSAPVRVGPTFERTSHPHRPVGHSPRGPHGRPAPQARHRGAVVLSSGIAMALGPPALAKVVERGTFHEEFSAIIKDFCDSGLDVTIDVTVDGRYQVNQRGRNGREYYLAHTKVVNVFTDQATGQTATDIQPNTLDKDLRITENDDGTLTILLLLTGGGRTYGDDGRLIAKNSGQIRVEIVVDAETFEEISNEVVFGSTGTNDDVCDAILTDWGYL